MSESLLESYRYKRTLWAFIGFSVVLVTLWIGLYMPLFYWLTSDVVWKGSDLATTWEFVVGPALQYAFYFGSFSFIIYGILRFGKKGYAFTAVYAVTAVRWYFLQPLSHMWILGAIHWSQFFSTDVPEFLFFLFMDGLQMGCVVLVLFLMGRKDTTNPKAARARRNAPPAEWGMDDLNRLRKRFFVGALLVAVISPLVMVAQRLYVEGFYRMIGAGLTFDAEGALLLLGVTLFFLADFLMIPVGYVVVRFIHWLLLRKSAPISFWAWLFGRVRAK